MKISVNAAIQALMLVAQAINMSQDVIPQEYRGWAAVAMSIIQGVVGVLAHFANPDGTPASTPYIKVK